jgi:exo beta-1,2-glucooligosaccharide sophorohydrolase (non-reducing end)
MFKWKLAVLFFIVAVSADAQEYNYTYRFFTNSAMAGDHFFSRTTATGNAAIKNSHHKLPVSQTVFNTPGNSLELAYTNGSAGSWQAVISHDNIRGTDHYKQPLYLSFYVYVTGNTISQNELPLIRFLKRDSSLTKSAGFTVTKTNQWERITMPFMVFGTNEMTKLNVIAGIVFTQQNPDGRSHQIYIDDIELVDRTQAATISSPPVLTSAKGYAKHIDISWQKDTSNAIGFVKIYRSVNNKDFTPVGIQQPYTSRYADYTGETGYPISRLTIKKQRSRLP